MAGILMKLVAAAVALGTLGGAAALEIYDQDRVDREHRRLVADGVEVVGTVTDVEHLDRPNGRTEATAWVAYDRKGARS